METKIQNICVTGDRKRMVIYDRERIEKEKKIYGGEYMLWLAMLSGVVVVARSHCRGWKQQLREGDELSEE